MPPCELRTSRHLLFVVLPDGSRVRVGPRRLHLVVLCRFLGRQEPDRDQIERADEAVADPEPAGALHRVPQRDGPLMLDQHQCGSRVVRDPLEDVPRVRVVVIGLTPLLGSCFAAGDSAGLEAFLAVRAETDQRADVVPSSIASSRVRLLRCSTSTSPFESL